MEDLADFLDNAMDRLKRISKELGNAPVPQTNYARLKGYLEHRACKPAGNLVAMPPRDWKYWMGLPPFADMYVRPMYDLIRDTHGLVAFLHYFLTEWEETGNPAKREAIEAVCFPIYRAWTGRNWDTKLIAL